MQRRRSLIDDAKNHESFDGDNRYLKFVIFYFWRATINIFFFDFSVDGKHLQQKYFIELDFYVLEDNQEKLQILFDYLKVILQKCKHLKDFKTIPRYILG